MITPDEVRGLVDHEVLEFSTEPRISVGYVDLDDLSFLVTDAARRFEPVVPAKTHVFGPGQRRRPTHVRVDSRVQVDQGHRLAVAGARDRPTTAAVTARWGGSSTSGAWALG